MQALLLSILKNRTITQGALFDATRKLAEEGYVEVVETGKGFRVTCIKDCTDITPGSNLKRHTMSLLFGRRWFRNTDVGRTRRITRPRLVLMKLFSSHYRKVFNAYMGELVKQNLVHKKAKYMADAYLLDDAITDGMVYSSIIPEGDSIFVGVLAGLCLAVIIFPLAIVFMFIDTSKLEIEQMIFIGVGWVALVILVVIGVMIRNALREPFKRK